MYQGFTGTIPIVLAVASVPILKQWKQHAMYEMRASIRDNQSVEDGRTRVKTHAGIISEAMLYEALLARDPDDGQNLLMYAVRWGRESWFLHLVRCIQDQVNSTFVSTRSRELVKSPCTQSNSSGSSCVHLARMATRQNYKPKIQRQGAITYVVSSS